MRNKDIFFKTKRKIINTSLSILLLGIFIFSTIILTFYSLNTFSNIDTELIIHAEKVSKQFSSGDLNRDFNISNNFVRKSILSMNPKVSTLIYFEDKLIYDTPNTYYLNHDFSIPINITSEKVETVDIESYKFRIFSVNLNKSITIQVLMNIESEIKSLTIFINVMIISLIFITIVSYFLSKYLSASVLKPIKKAYDSQVHFIQDASHEMRTPLAIIKGKIELLSSKSDEKIINHFEVISSIISEIRGLEKLNRNLLQLSKEDIDTKLNITNFKLHTFINDISSFYYMLAESQNKNFVVNLNTDDLLVNWDAPKVQQAIIILLENAFKYSNSDDYITLSLSSNNKNKVFIKISDTGIGIKENELPRIFDRFYRSDIVRGNNISGSGIGLSLLKSLSNILNFTIDVSSKINEGTTFILTFPINMNK